VQAGESQGQYLEPAVMAHVNAEQQCVLLLHLPHMLASVLVLAVTLAPLRAEMGRC
jgi:hypothetical protein